MSAADALGYLRAALAVPIAWSILIGARELALALFIAAALTDAIDGYLARRWGRLGPRGDFLDPMADKILIVVTLLALTVVGSGWPVTLVTVLVALREGLVTILRARAFARGVGLRADTLAKAKTALEMVGVALVIVGGRPWAVLGTGVVGVAFLVGLFTIRRYWDARVA